MSNSLNENSCCSQEQQRCQDVQPAVISDDFKLAGALGDKLFFSAFGHVGTDARVTFKRVSYSSRSVRSGHQIGTVHSSTMSTTRSWSGPREVALASDLNGHAVLGLDLLNKIPSSGDLFGWINDLDTFIKEKNIGLQKEQVGTEGARTTDATSEQFIAANEEALNNKSGKECDQNPAAGDRTSRSELFTVRHFRSFSQIGSTK